MALLGRPWPLSGPGAARIRLDLPLHRVGSDATITHVHPEEGSLFAPGYYSGSDNMRMRGALRFTSPP